MTEDEIRKAIAERKRLAGSLKLRESLWDLYCYGVSKHPKYLAENPEMILPEVKHSFCVEDNDCSFIYGGKKHEIGYREGKKEAYYSGSCRRKGSLHQICLRAGFLRDSIEVLCCGAGKCEGRMETTPITVTLKIDGERVFEFKLAKTVEYESEKPLISHSLGEVTAYISGPWTTSLLEAKNKIDEHQKRVLSQRHASIRLQNLGDEMKRFGLSMSIAPKTLL